MIFIYPLPCHLTGLTLRGSCFRAFHHRNSHSAPRRPNGQVADWQRQRRAETARSSSSGERYRVRGSMGGCEWLGGMHTRDKGRHSVARKLAQMAMPRACGWPVRRRGSGPGDGHGAGGAAEQQHWPAVARVGAGAGARPIHRAVPLVPRTFGRELLAGTCGARMRPPPRKLRAVARALGVSGWMAASWRHRRRFISISTTQTHRIYPIVRGCNYVMTSRNCKAGGRLFVYKGPIRAALPHAPTGTGTQPQRPSARGVR